MAAGNTRGDRIDDGIDGGGGGPDAKLGVGDTGGVLEARGETTGREKNALARQIALSPRAWRSGHPAAASVAVAAGGV